MSDTDRKNFTNILNKGQLDLVADCMAKGEPINSIEKRLSESMSETQILKLCQTVSNLSSEIRQRFEQFYEQTYSKIYRKRAKGELAGLMLLCASVLTL